MEFGSVVVLRLTKFSGIGTKIGDWYKNSENAQEYNLCCLKMCIVQNVY